MRGTATSESRAPARCPHLGPMCCALAAAAALLGGVRDYVGARLPGRLPFYAENAMSFKVNGTVLQRLAFRTPDELPIYGSSELDLRIENRPDAFFRQRPTGFAVFPVGRGGATCLMILQKLAAVGEAARGRKVVIILSSTWFLQPTVAEDAVGANLAGAQLSAWIFGGSLSPALKTDIARRLLDFPGGLENQTLNAAALRCLAAPSPWNRLRFDLLVPLGKLQNALLQRLDYGVLFWEMIFPQRRFLQGSGLAQSAAPAAGGSIDWDRLAAQAAAGSGEAPNFGGREPGARPGDHDAEFLARLRDSREFGDFALLIRVLQELKLTACFISQPFNGAYSDSRGTTQQTRHAYYERVQALLRSTGYPMRDFSENEEDRFFFSDEDHPSAKAWIFYDREIDRFYREGAGK